MITLRFRQRLPGGARGATFTRTGEVYGDDPSLGLIEYQWVDSDFTGSPPPFVAGTYDLKTNIFFNDGGSLTVPTLEPSALYVSDSLSS
jgi:diadenosine tetraphosphatase ApaH/serine/threonine PP2A family protein phosphatase